MRDKNKRIWTKLVTCKELINKIHLTSTDVFATAIIFGGFSDITDIV